MEREFKNLLKEAKKAGIEINNIREAFEFAKVAHEGQKRLTGEDFVYHPLEVAKTIISWKLDNVSVIAALLHDTVEDNPNVSLSEIEQKFGHEVCMIVDGVTKVTDIRLRGSKEEQFTENLRKMLLVMAKDLRVVFVKLADRFHNMKTLYALSLAKQKENSLETLEIYAPLAERLGFGGLKGELEDLAFKYAYPKEFNILLKESHPHMKNAYHDVGLMKTNLKLKLMAEGLKVDVHGRKKHLYSLWKKLLRDEVGGDYTKINDIVALRILVEDISACYKALGLVHSLYKPVPYIGISDFIAQPKPNGYRSIHTKVFGPRKRIVDVQIRTQEMHREAEFGVVAHWAYSERKGKMNSDHELEKKGVVVIPKLSWIRQLVRWQEELKGTKEFLEACRFEVFQHRNFIFSPKGDVFDLPLGATPVDFAYEVHSDLGDFIKGAKVNGKVVPLSYQLKSGQLVEIIKSKNKRKPSRDWLSFVVTGTARRKIKRMLTLER